MIMNKAIIMTVKKNLIRALVLSICLSFNVPVYAAPATTTKDKIKEKEEQQKKLKAGQEALKEKIASLKKEQTDLLEYIALLDEELDRLTTEALELEERKVLKEVEIAQTKASLVAVRQAEAKQYESMKLRIKYMYEQKNRNILDLFFDSVGVQAFLNHNEYVQKIVEYDRKKLTEFVATRKSIEAYELKLENELFDLELLVEAANMAVSNMELLLADKDAEITKYSESILENEGAQNVIDAEWDKLEEELKKLEEQLKKEEEEAKKNTPKYDGGQFIWPLKDYFKVTSPYGYRTHPKTHKWSLHNGIDIGAPTGTKIMAAGDGVVATMKENNTAGKYVMINHGSGVYTVYMHCSRFVAKVGQEVKAGDIIALVGSTGSSTAPHLHFSVRLNGTYVDPSPYVGYTP